MVWSDGTATAAPSADAVLRKYFEAPSLDGFADHPAEGPCFFEFTEYFFYLL